MRKNLFIISVATLLMAGCDSSNILENINPDEIRIVANVDNTRATATSFETGDKMAIFAVEYDGDEVAALQVAGNYINNELMAYNGSAWIGNRTLYWSENPCDFYALYPYHEPTSMTSHLFELPTDQNSPETESSLSGYEAADLLWAKATKVSRADGVVKFSFKHLMSKVIVKIERGATFEGELSEDIVVHLYNTKTSTLLDMRTGSLNADPNGSHKTINMRKVSKDTFEAIVVPQFIERSTPLVEITMEDIAYLLNYTMSFRPGFQHTITITLNTSPDQEKIEIAIDGSVEGWK